MSGSGHLWRNELPPAQRRALENLVKYGDMAHGLKTRAEHGGLISTRAALIRKGFVDPNTHQITEAGRIAMRGVANPIAVERERAAGLADAHAVTADKHAREVEVGSDAHKIFLARADEARRIASNIRAGF